MKAYKLEELPEVGSAEFDKWLEDTYHDLIEDSKVTITDDQEYDILFIETDLVINGYGFKHPEMHVDSDVVVLIIHLPDEGPAGVYFINQLDIYAAVMEAMK